MLEFRKPLAPPPPAGSLPGLSRSGRQAEQRLPDLLEHGGVRLHLLGDRVDVAKPPLERVAGEDRGGAGRVIAGIDHVARLVDREGRGQTQP